MGETNIRTDEPDQDGGRRKDVLNEASREHFSSPAESLLWWYFFLVEFFWFPSSRYKRKTGCVVGLEGSGHRAGIFHFKGYTQRPAAQLTKSVFILKASLMWGESKTGFVVSSLVQAHQKVITLSSFAALRGEVRSPRTQAKQVWVLSIMHKGRREHEHQLCE